MLILASILLGSSAQLLIKLGINGLPAELQEILANPGIALGLIILGLAAYGLSLLLWMMALANYELSFAYPMLSTSYILVYLGAVLLPQLNETVSPGKTLGILLIVVGVIFVTSSKSREGP
ncbi:MAG TPA: 4-amino-4-deoxy-L-arabinose-phospho-UDP flippase [Gammaproteobacteria bacterium]|nr:4-amino-4-deoxy-L-arabinose-phospho-UDP flippase [Gammaproteobacteria bacterium]